MDYGLPAEVNQDVIASSSSAGRSQPLNDLAG
jgi:hypothetical protein